MSRHLGLPPLLVQGTAIIAAVSAGMLTLFATPSVMATPGWTGEAIAGVVVAAVWMATGAALSRSPPVTCALLLLVGAAISRYLAFGIMAGMSLYYGIATYIPATLAGGAVWTFFARRHRQTVRWPLLVTAVLVVVQLSRVLVFGMPGEPRRMQNVNGTVAVSVVRHGDHTFVWQPSGSAVFSALDSMTATVDLSNSGASPHRFARVTDPVEHANVCRTLDASTRERIRAEVAAGTVPALVARLPMRFRDCRRGTMWRAATG